LNNLILLFLLILREKKEKINMNVQLEGKMIYRLIVSMKKQCFYHEALKDWESLKEWVTCDEKEQALIIKENKEIKQLIKKYKDKEKKMFAGALG
jgi:hypothetical protein